MNDTPNTKGSVLASAALKVGLGVAVWLGVGFSMGWYYTFTYYGRAGWPMPVPEVCASLILYYFSVLNVDTEIQAVHWMLVFPAAAGLWVASLRVLAGKMGAKLPPFAGTYLMFSLAALPMALPGPWTAWIAAATPDGPTWARMMAVALRRGSVSSWQWLSPMYFGLGLASFGLQVLAYRRLFPGRAARPWVHYPLSGILLVLASAVTGAVAALPLRALLER